jgi:hypothetical protein
MVTNRAHSSRTAIRCRRIGGCSGGYGADLPFIPAPFVYHVAIVDTAKIYAGATVPNLNGAMPLDLDVVLFHLPMGGVAAVAAGERVMSRPTSTDD